MVALTAGRNTPKRERNDVEGHPVLNGVTVFVGAQVCLNAAGFAIPAAIGVGLIPLGRADATVVGDGVKPVTTRRGTFRWNNSAASDAIGRPEIGDQAFMVDDQTVAKTDGGGTRSPAGIIRDVDAQGVWVLI